MEERDKLWEQVVKDFPGDPALQEVHYARLKIREKTRGMSDAEFVAYIKAQSDKALSRIRQK